MPRINKHLVISTCHVTADVAEQLDLIVKSENRTVWDADTDWQYWVIAERWSDYGWWVWVKPEGDDGWDELPECLRRVFHLAAREQCTWVLFDCDEEPIPHLLQHEW